MESVHRLAFTEQIGHEPQACGAVTRSYRVDELEDACRSGGRSHLFDIAKGDRRSFADERDRLVDLD